MTKDDDCKRVIKKFDDFITALVDAVASQNVLRGPYSDEVYKAAKNVAKAYPKMETATRSTHRLTEIAENDLMCHKTANSDSDLQGPLWRTLRAQIGCLRRSGKCHFGSRRTSDKLTRPTRLAAPSPLSDQACQTPR